MGSIRNVAVVGAGTMGQGIAHVTAAAGFPTFLFDALPGQAVRAIENIEKNLTDSVGKGRITPLEVESIMDQLHPVTEISELRGQLAIEAAVERLDAKKELFSSLERTLPGAILASNTSSLSIAALAAGLKDPSRCVGLHFFNPADRMKLVEVVAAPATSTAVVEEMKVFSRSIGKTAVLVKDSPGFIVNRVARHFYLESLKILGEGSVDAKAIDALMRSAGFRMGPFELMDLIGVDVNLAVSRSVYEGFSKAKKFEPSPIQEKMVEQGRLGRKTGKGFYEYQAKG